MSAGVCHTPVPYLALYQFQLVVIEPSVGDVFTSPATTNSASGFENRAVTFSKKSSLNEFANNIILLAELIGQGSIGQADSEVFRAPSRSQGELLQTVCCTYFLLTF